MRVNDCPSPAIYSKLRKLYAGRQFSSLFFHYRWTVFPHETVLRFVPAAGKIFDIGCGYGISTNYLAIASPAREVTGIELDPHRYARAAWTGGKYPNVRFIHGDINLLQIEACDAILLNDVLHHLRSFEEQERLLARCYRLLRGAGRLVIADINDEPLWKFAIAFVIDHLYYRRLHIPYRNRGNLHHLLERIGFVVDSYCLDKGVPFSTVVYVATKSSGDGSPMEQMPVAAREY